MTSNRWAPLSRDIWFAFLSLLAVTNAHAVGNDNRDVKAKTITNGSGVVNVPSSGTVTIPNGTDTVVTKTSTDTLINKTLTSPAINSGTITTPTVVGSGGTLTLPAGPDTLAGIATAQTLTNKILVDTSTPFAAVSDNTKRFHFVLSGITAGQDRAVTMPDSSGTLAYTSSNVATATALAANPADCGSNNYATAIAANGDLTCSTVTDSGLAVSYIKADGSRPLTAGWNVGAFSITASSFIGALTGNASTASALAADPADCASNTYATGINAAGTLACGAVNAAAGLTGATPIANGGTGQTTAAAAFNALHPMTTTGDIMYSSSGTTAARLGIGSAAQMLTVAGGIPSWADAPAGGINYITNPGCEGNSSTGWAAYADAAGVLPVDATAGSPNTTITVTSSSPLRGTYSCLLTKSTGASRQGEGVSAAFTIAATDQSTALAVSFDYGIVSGTFTASDGITAPASTGTTVTAGDSTIEVYVYDVTNSVLIPVSPHLLTSTSSTSGHFKGSFQASSNSTSYRLAFHTSYTTSAAMVFAFDNVVINALVPAIGSPISDWAAYTPTFTGWGTVSSVAMAWRRVGDSVQLRGRVTSGTATGVEARMSLPAGLVADSAKVSSLEVVGAGIGGDTGVFAAFPLAEPSVAYITFGRLAASVVAFSKVLGNAAFSNGVAYTIEATVPVSGWSSAVQMSSDTDTRVVAAKYTSGGATTVIATATATALAWSTLVKDTHSMCAAGVCTVPVPGFYRVMARVLMQADNDWGSGETAQIDTYVNAAVPAGGRMAYHWFESTGTNVLSLGGETTVFANAGDTITPKLTQASGGNVALNSSADDNWFSVERVSGPATIAATDKVSFMYGHAAATAVTSITTLPCDTKTYDSHNAVASGVFTAPSSGYYHFDVGIGVKGATFVLNDLVQLDIVQAGSASVTRSIKGYAAAAVTQLPLTMDVEMNLIAGDTVQAKVTSARASSTLSGTVNENFFGGYLIK